MHLCRTPLLRPLLICTSIVWVLALAVVAPGLAQETTPLPENSTRIPGETPGVLISTATLSPTVTSTPSPSPTPTLTPTLTAMQARLMLAQAYLEGGDYTRAAELFSAVALEDRGNPEALAGLRAALSTAAVTPIGPTATATPLPQTVSFRETFANRWRDLAGAALPGLLLVVLVYLLAQGIRWLLYWARELWLIHGLPLLGLRPVYPGYLLADFTDATGLRDFRGTQIVKQSLTEILLAWNQLVQTREVPVEPAPSLDLGSMGWIKVLWSWILPPPRGYKVTGVLMGDQPGAYRLSVTRSSLSTNAVDRSFTFSDQSLSQAPDEAFRELAKRAARWLLLPLDMEAAETAQWSAAKGTRRIVPQAEADFTPPDKIFDQALELLLPLRHQIEQDAIDFPMARQRLAEADRLVGLLPEGSALRRDLQTTISDLKKHVGFPINHKD